MDEPWRIYYEELHDRAATIPDQAFNRGPDMAEAAHEAYEAVADRLVIQLDLAEEDALSLTRSFGRAVKTWIEEDVYDWDDLLTRLEATQAAWEQEAGFTA